MLAQSSVALAAYLCLLGAREYMGRAPLGAWRCRSGLGASAEYGLVFYPGEAELFNRRAFLTLLDKAISNAQRTQTTLPVLVMDLDHFKKVNDSWGHRAGDDVLRQL